MTFSTPAEFVDDLVKVPTVDAAVQNPLASERGRESLQQPQYLLYRLSSITFAERSFRSRQGFLNHRFGLRVQGWHFIRHSNWYMYPGGDKLRRVYLEA